MCGGVSGALSILKNAKTKMTPNEEEEVINLLTFKV